MSHVKNGVSSDTSRGKGPGYRWEKVLGMLDDLVIQYI